MTSSEQFLRLAAQTARRGMLKKAGGPFGAVIVRNGRVIAQAHNTVLRDQNATCHAEVNAIGAASKKLKRFDLSGCDIYSTTEPCPMCFSAIHWARIARVFYSTTIADVHRLGFNELTISNQLMKRWGKSPVVLKKVSSAACRRLLKEWSGLAVKKTY